MFFEEWYDPLISGIRWTEELVEIAGGEPIFPELADAGLAKDRIVTGEQVIARAPDMIIGSWCGKPVRKERISARPGWQDVPAVKNGRIYEVKSTYILQPGPGGPDRGRGAAPRRDFPSRGYNVEMTRIAFVLALAVLAAACRNTPGAATGTSKPASGDAWAVVNGNEITRDDVEKAYRRAAPAGQQPAEEEALTAKLNLLNELIVQQLLLEKAAQLKVEVPDAELDKAYLDAKNNIPEDAFETELKSRNLTAADMREDLRRNLLAQKVVEKEVADKVAVTDADITAFYEANKAAFNRTEDAVHIAQIVISARPRAAADQSHRRRRLDAAGGDRESADADGEAQGRRELRRARRGLLGGSANRRSVAATSASCRYRRCSRRRRRCATRCSSRRPAPCSWSARAARTPSCSPSPATPRVRRT